MNIMIFMFHVIHTLLLADVFNNFLNIIDPAHFLSVPEVPELAREAPFKKVKLNVLTDVNILLMV